MRRKFTTFIFVILLAVLSNCAKSYDEIVTIHTRFGDMKVILYPETPKHKENFLKLAREGSFDSTNFHRVIQGFMIQGGDINKVEPGACDYTLPAEFNDRYVHTKGSLAAARLGDNVNPKKESSGCQFYIVQGNRVDPDELQQMVKNKHIYYYQAKFKNLLSQPEYKDVLEKMIEYQRQGNNAAIEAKMQEMIPLIEEKYGKPSGMEYTEEQLNAYKTLGGSPHLDGDYTVFGKVVEGMSVIDSVASVKTRKPGDSPLEPVYMEMEVDRMSKRKITKEFGYEYPKEEK